MSFLDNILNRVRSGAIRMAQRTHRPRTEPPTPQAVSARLKRENPIAFKDSELKDKGYTGLSNLEKIKMRDKIRKQGDETVETTSVLGDYKDVGGILFPHSMSMSFGEMTFSGKVSKMVVNEKIDLKDFKE